VYAPIDLSRQALSRGLLESGFNQMLKTLFIWEGVTYYLTAKAIDESLAFIANHSGPQGCLLFDYTDPELITGTSQLKEAINWRKFERNNGEPLLFGIIKEMMKINA